MPTMAKLFAAVLLGALAYVAADAVGNHFPPEDRQGALRQLSAFFGVVIGWRFLGKRVNRGWYGSLGVGLSAGDRLDGWAFSQFDGTVYWDHSGIHTQIP